MEILSSGPALDWPAGNVLNDPAGTGRSYTYDAENRVKTATMPNTPAITYSYDGEGRRVRKEVAGQATTVFVYDAFGQLAAEYGPADGIGVRYLTVDHLGSTRMVTDQSGAVVKRMDYLPFGEEYPAVPELDGADGGEVYGEGAGCETGLDYFGARYMSAAQGRFTSPDHYNIIMEASGEEEFASFVSNPQNWNRYAYVTDNPLSITDPDGGCPWCPLLQRPAPYAEKAATAARDCLGKKLSCRTAFPRIKGFDKLCSNLSTRNKFMRDPQGSEKLEDTRTGTLGCVRCRN